MLKRHWKVSLTFIAIALYGLLLYSQNQIATGPYGVLFRVSTATDTTTLTTSQMAPGILIGTPTAAANYTTPTATQFCTAFPAVAIQAPGTNSNYGYDLKIRNTSTGANTITLIGGSSVTLAAGNTNTIAQNHTRTFVVVPTACPAPGQSTPSPTVTIYSAQDSAH